MFPTWPATLPALSEQSGFEEQPPDLLLASNMDAGPPKRRRRATAGVSPARGTMLLHSDQVEILDAFFRQDLASGALPFDATHPRTGAAIAALLKRPSYRHLSGLYWEAAIELEILP